MSSTLFVCEHTCVYREFWYICVTRKLDREIKENDI